MSSLILAVLVLMSWACAEGVAPPRQYDKAADASADATEEKAASSVQAPEEQEGEQERQEEQL